MTAGIDNFLRPFGLHTSLHAHAAHVLGKLPDEVRTDIMGEGGVVFYDYDPGPGVVMQVPVKIPGPSGASRSIVLNALCAGERPISFNGSSPMSWLTLIFAMAAAGPAMIRKLPPIRWRGHGGFHGRRAGEISMRQSLAQQHLFDLQMRPRHRSLIQLV